MANDSANDSLDRLKKIDYWLCDLSNYGHLGDDELESIITQANSLLGDRYLTMVGLGVGVEKNLPSPDKIDAAIEQVMEKINQVRSMPIWKKTIKAYSDNHQNDLARLMPKIFPNLTVCTSRYSKALYYGISVLRGQTVADYVNRALNIKEEGIFASAHNRHHAMDEYLRPIYTVVDPEETHGFLFFALGAVHESHTIFNPHFEAERLIYTPCNVPVAALHLKSTSYLESKLRIEGCHGNREFHRYFRTSVQEELERRNIPYALNDPKGFQKAWGCAIHRPPCC